MKRFLLAAFGWLLAAGSAGAAGLPANALQSSVGSVTAVTSTAGVMAGIAATAPQFTPHYDGVALVTISGNAVFGGAATGIISMRSGTGAGPANGATATGSACAPTQAPVNAVAGAATVGFSTTCVVTGLALNVPYWFDLVIGSSASTMQVTNVSVSAVEQ